MERFTISLNDDLAAEFDALIRARGYVNRSEAVRDLLRREIAIDRVSHADAPHCVATISYVYDHHQRHLSERLADLQHHRHELVISSMHVHLDHQDCMESLFLRGPTEAVRAFAGEVSAETGVRHSMVNLIALARGDSKEREHGHD